MEPASVAYWLNTLPTELHTYPVVVAVFYKFYCSRLLKKKKFWTQNKLIMKNTILHIYALSVSFCQKPADSKWNITQLFCLLVLILAHSSLVFTQANIIQCNITQQHKSSHSNTIYFVPHIHTEVKKSNITERYTLSSHSCSNYSLLVSIQ